MPSFFKHSNSNSKGVHKLKPTLLKKTQHCLNYFVPQSWFFAPKPSTVCDRCSGRDQSLRWWFWRRWHGEYIKWQQRVQNPAQHRQTESAQILERWHAVTTPHFGRPRKPWMECHIWRGNQSHHSHPGWGGIWHVAPVCPPALQRSFVHWFLFHKRVVRSAFSVQGRGLWCVAPIV